MSQDVARGSWLRHAVVLGTPRMFATAPTRLRRGNVEQWQPSPLHLPLRNTETQPMRAWGAARFER